ncbi:MAG: hypothetical protein OEM02_08480 [Desulfobulbaceae bacterium]|nr:hypothetical protein [Desulfobulbaceae bacterium]
MGDIKKPLLLHSTDSGNGCVHRLKSGYSKEITRKKTHKQRFTGVEPEQSIMVKNSGQEK